MTQLIDLNGKPLRNVEAVKREDKFVVMTTDMTYMPWPKKHMKPEGELLGNMESAALWYFLQVAHVAMEELGGQVTLEDDMDSEIKLKQSAKQIAETYGVELEDMFGPVTMGYARMEVARCKMTIDNRIESFIRTGGQAYNDVDRKV